MRLRALRLSHLDPSRAVLGQNLRAVALPAPLGWGLPPIMAPMTYRCPSGSVKHGKNSWLTCDKVQSSVAVPSRHLPCVGVHSKI